MKKNTKILTLVFVVAFLILLIGCLPGLTPPTPKGVINGRIMVPSPEIAKDITGWIPIANATVTLIDSEGVTHTVTTDEDGYYTFTDIAVNANTIITATATIDGNTVIVKDIIPQAVAADEDYDAKTADAESTALALIVEELLEQGLDPKDVNLEEIQDSDNFTEVVEQITSILEENGNITTDPGLDFTVGNVAEDIISPPVYIPPEETPEPEYTLPPVTPAVNHPPIITSTPITTATEGVAYTYDVEATDPDDDVLVYSLTDEPSGMIINSAIGVINWTPTPDQVGNNPVNVNASDGVLSNTQSFTIEVSKPPAPPPDNYAPIITPISDLTIIVGVEYTCTIEATDQVGDVLTYSLINEPDGMLIDENSGIITWTPTAVGSFGVTVEVSDGELSGTQDFTITVIVDVDTMGRPQLLGTIKTDGDSIIFDIQAVGQANDGDEINPSNYYSQTNFDNEYFTISAAGKFLKYNMFSGTTPYWGTSWSDATNPLPVGVTFSQTEDGDDFVYAVSMSYDILEISAGDTFSVQIKARDFNDDFVQSYTGYDGFDGDYSQYCGLWITDTGIFEVTLPSLQN